jgi:hypothetical protein
MNMMKHTDLVRIACYTTYEAADIARSFLNRRGVAGVVVVDKSAAIEDEADQVFAGGTFDLLVPEIDSAKAVVLLGEEWRIEEDLGSPVADDLTEQSGTL